ncbi:MAG: S24/S26 family peptidase [Candidatus Omnitrophica bacterium]|nr:S24/S26 family peptidase [Candidatus Omnitrophota bacterium]
MANRRLIVNDRSKKEEISGDREFLFFNVKGPSMFPFIREGDGFLARRAVAKDLRTGDIILYYPARQGPGVCHRLLKKEQKNGKIILYAQADAWNEGPDIVIEDELWGKAVAVIRGRRIINISSFEARLFGRTAAAILHFARAAKKCLLGCVSGIKMI